MKKVVVELGQSGDIKTVLQQIDPKFSKVMCIIIGDPGDGKSSQACAFGLEEMLFTRSKLAQACERINEINNVYGPVLKLPQQKHLVYCSGFTIYKNSKMQSYDFDPFRIGMPDKNFQTQYFERGSLRIIDEIQAYFNSTMKLPKRVEQNFQKCRHYKIFNVGTAQHGMEVHVRLRRLASFLRVLGVKTKCTPHGFVEETQWECLYLGNNSNFEAYEQNNKSEDYVICKVIFKLKKNIFNYYNPNSCEEEFDDVYNSYSMHFDNSGNRSSTNPPKGYYKNTEIETIKEE